MGGNPLCACSPGSQPKGPQLENDGCLETKSSVAKSDRNFASLCDRSAACAGATARTYVHMWVRGELPLQIFPSKNGSGLGSIVEITSEDLAQDVSQCIMSKTSTCCKNILSNTASSCLSFSQGLSCRNGSANKDCTTGARVQ